MIIKRTHLDRYLSERGIADSSRAIYRHILEALIAEVRPGDEGWLPRAASWVQEKALLPKTKSLYASTARVFMRWCIKQGLAKDNPFDDIRIRAAVARGRRAFTKDEVRQIVASIAPPKDTKMHVERALRDKAVILLMLYTGMRVAGVMHVDIEDCERIGGGRIRLRYLNKGHQGKDSRVLLPPAVLEALKIYLEGSGRTWESTGPMFLGPRGRASKSSLVRSVISRIVDAGIEGHIHVHLLRHTAATTAYRAGVDLMGIRDMLGQKDLSTTQQYLHSIGAEDAAAEYKIDYGLEGDDK